ncbi:hypothetical protein [Propionivibrio sp.]|uniref:hypothetical protein n=1 Tax=Propionivibrio sp. TaxID=2212460 RepID=UPI0039E476DD
MLALNERLETGLHAMLAGDEDAPPAGLSLDALAAMQASAVPLEPTAAVRLLARAAALGPLPEDIERLARELSAASGQERRELLEIELRRAIQRFQEEAARAAGALVLEQTLEDLGYQVEGVSETLFVEGGLVHFRRPGWGDYQVRLRVKAHAGGSGFEAGANFNVVRAVDAGDNERSVLDHLAEDRWCAEFPALLQALALRGLRLEVTRRLAAGELPVQLVERAQLPRFTDEDAARPPTQLRQKEIR